MERIYLFPGSPAFQPAADDGFAQSFAARIIVDIGPGCIDTVASVRHIIIEHLEMIPFLSARVPKIMVPNTILLISRVKSPDVMDAYRVRDPSVFP